MKGVAYRLPRCLEADPLTLILIGPLVNFPFGLVAQDPLVQEVLTCSPALS